MAPMHGLLSSEIFGQIHAGIQLTDLWFITVEHQSFDFFR
jgi:hypothetical protein